MKGSYLYVINRDNQSALLFMAYWDLAGVVRTKIFELPGNYLQINEVSASGAGLAYPNPTDNIIEIPLRIHNESDVSFKIFNAAGVLVDVKLLDPQAQKIRYQTNSLQPGIYIYAGGGVSGKFIVK